MSTSSNELTGKSAVVTGAARGIGLAIARIFAAEGANVLLADLDTKAVESAAQEIAETYNVKAVPLKVDVGSAGDNQKMISTAIEIFGSLDILVCNAGIVRPGKPIEDITPEQWEQVIAVNLLSCVHATTAFVPHAKKQKSGRIIYMASIAGQVGGVASEMTYPVTKAGVLCMTKAVARQLGPFNVTVNAIAPGTIVTAMTDVLQYSSDVMKSIPLNRYGEVDDIAQAALYLASERAKYVTGATLDINGGLGMR